MTRKTTEGEEAGMDSPLARAQGGTLGKLEAMHRLMFPERDIGDFQITFLDPHMRIERSTEQLRGQMKAAEELRGKMNGKPLRQADGEVVKRLMAFHVSCGFFIKSIRASGSGETSEAWPHLVECNYFLGYLQGRLSTKSAHSQSSSGADALHAENRAMKAEVFAWLDTNMARFKSMDAAAAEIAQKVVPMTFRTVRDWVGEWKKLRSAGRP